MNMTGAAQLTDGECKRVFSPGFKLHTASVSSDGIGLDSVKQAVSAAGGSAQLRSTSSHTTFRVELPAEVVAGVAEGGEGGCGSGTVDNLAGQPAQMATPAPISPPDQRPAPAPAPAPAAGPILPAEQTMPSAEFAPSVESNVPAAEPLTCIGIDDSTGNRAFHHALFKHLLNADMGRSIALGETVKEQAAFVDIVLGRLDIHLQEVAPKLQRHAE